MNPQVTDGDARLGRLPIEKQFQGDLEATSKGEMLTGGTVVKGSAGYVAMELVTGKLHGRSGSFPQWLIHPSTHGHDGPRQAVFERYRRTGLRHG